MSFNARWGAAAAAAAIAAGGLLAACGGDDNPEPTSLAITAKDAGKERDARCAVRRDRRA